jgi:tetratricopeptide (TPR) repeat protein
MSKFNLKKLIIIKFPSAPAENNGTSYYPYTLQANRADLLRKIGKWNEGEEACLCNLAAARKAKNYRLIAESANELGFLLMQRGKLQESLPLFQESLDLCDNAYTGKQRHITLCNTGTLYRNLGNYVKAGEYYLQALAQAENFGDNNWVSIIQGNLGLMYWYMGEHQKAMECSALKMKIDIEANDQQLICTGYANLGSIHFSMGNYVLAENCYHKQTAIARQIGDKYSLRVAMNNLAGIYDNREDYDRALECYSQSLGIARELGNKSGERVVTNNIALLISYRGDFDQALDLAEQSLKLACQMGDRRGEGIVHYTMGNIYKDRREYLRSQEEYLTAQEIFEGLSVKEYLCESLNSLAQVMLEQKDIKQARKYSRQARQLAELLNRQEYLAGLDKLDADIGLEAGEFTTEEYEALVEPLAAKASAKIQAEILFRLYRVTGKHQYGKAAREVILSRPNWQFRLDYREWMKILDAQMTENP